MRATSLIITTFGDAILPRGGRIWLGSLIQLLEPLQLNERLIRTSVFRLVKDEWLRVQSVGRRSDYLLTQSGRRRFEEASRHIYASSAPLWDRRWRVILVVGDLEPKQRDALRRALFWQGFGALGNDCFAHPGADLTDVLDALIADGLAPVLPKLLPLFAADARLARSATDADLVARAWDLSHLSAAYTEFIGVYQPMLDVMRREGLAGVSDAQAFLLRLLLIHDYRRLLLRDPELPEVLLPQRWPGQLARLLCKEMYQRLEEASDRHLDEQVCLADGSRPEVDLSLWQRFARTDPIKV
ncbi:phenylacetic acid degradation operon negative regulatory protein PaaX [Comamonas faecalis]|uniref:Phenylacetic acid degradation operon negative regulatory protein PaaX n=1 Tax=Comamonas faecalis TaxID=1387849 RepID=A0ABP7QWV0_9BURK